MADFLEVGLDVIVIALSVGLAFYSFRLYDRVFRGGIFGRTFKFLIIGALIFSVAEATDVVVELMELRVLTNLHIILEAVFVVTLFVSIFLFYNSWIEMSRK